MELRADIKAHAKERLKDNYGVSLAAIIVSGLITAAAAYTWVGGFLIGLPLSLGVMCHFTLVFYGGTPEFSTMFKMGFGINYGRKLGGTLWMNLWIFLWSLLFVIPGIIKTYEYAMTPYILANSPDVEAIEALNLSKRITRGHKGELFVFDLSYIGWWLLSSLTCGLLALFYVTPYYSTAHCGYLGELVEQSVKDGVVSVSELNPNNTQSSSNYSI